MKKGTIICSIGAILQAASFFLINSGPDVQEISGLAFAVAGTIALLVGGWKFARHRGLRSWLGLLAILNIAGILAILLASLPTTKGRKLAALTVYGATIAIIVGIVIWFQLPDPQIKKMSKDLFHAKINGNTELVWNAACPELQTLLVQEYGSRSAVIRMLQQDTTAYAELDQWEIGDFIDLGDRATVPIVLQFKNGMRDIFYLYLIKIDGEWMIHR
ncbi:DUF4878 domain-containing protein [Verrucomicrobiota bacterium]